MLTRLDASFFHLNAVCHAVSAVVMYLSNHGFLWSQFGDGRRAGELHQGTEGESG